MKTRSAEAAAVLAAIPQDAITRMAALFPSPADIALREDREYFREVLLLYTSPDIPQTATGRLRYLRQELASRQGQLIDTTRDYLSLLHGDLSSIDDKTLIARFKTDPENGMHVTLFTIKNALSFERTMVSVLLEEIGQIEEACDD